MKIPYIISKSDSVMFYVISIKLLCGPNCKKRLLRRFYTQNREFEMSNVLYRVFIIWLITYNMCNIYTINVCVT